MRTCFQESTYRYMQFLFVDYFHLAATVGNRVMVCFHSFQALASPKVPKFFRIFFKETRPSISFWANLGVSSNSLSNDIFETNFIYVYPNLPSPLSKKRSY